MTASTSISACAWIATCAVLMSACAGGDDPSKPRNVRTVEREPATRTEPPPRSDTSPSRGIPCDVQTSDDLKLCGAATDNYKASFNANPDESELRTWLALHELVFDGNRFQLDGAHDLFQRSVRLRSKQGQAITLSARIADGPGQRIDFRVGPQRGLWGPLLMVDAPLRRGENVVVELLVDGAVRASVEYRYDRKIANVSRSSLEFNGPRGRWYLTGDIATATNLELGWE